MVKKFFIYVFFASRYYLMVMNNELYFILLYCNLEFSYSEIRIPGSNYLFVFLHICKRVRDALFIIAGLRR